MSLGWRMATSFKDVDLYDYPEYYEILFDDGTSEEADFLEAIFAEYGRPKTQRLLEPACGTGRLLIELAKRGYEAHGFDDSEAVHERWVVDRGGQRVICNTRTWPADRKRRRERVRNRLRIEAQDSSKKLHESSWEFRTYDASQLRRLLKKVPELTLVASYDFAYDLTEPRELDDSQEDIVLVLRR